MVITIRKSHVGMIMVAGIVWLSIIIMPTSAQINPLDAVGLPDCWAKMITCLGTFGIDINDPEADYKPCCPVIRPQITNNATCFCSIKEYSENLLSDKPAVAASEVELLANTLLAGCKMDSTYDQLCTGTNDAGSGNTGSLPGIVKNGAIKIASIGFLPGILFVWTIIMS